jgi:hypothetical protein
MACPNHNVAAESLTERYKGAAVENDTFRQGNCRARRINAVELKEYSSLSGCLGRV